MDLSIIIVNYNVKYFLEQCLCSVIKACKNIKAEIFVVDNHSSDGSREYLPTKFPEVIFKWEDENAGFAKANNSVIAAAKGEIVLFLNPDTILPEDCFGKCLDFFKMRERCGALGVRMIDGSGNFLRESKRAFPSPMASFFKMTGFSKMFPSSKLFSKYYAGHLPEDKINETDVLAGAFFMIRKKTLNEVSGFDEDFFMYAEDIDLSYRIQKAGYKNYYFPDTTVIHFKGESTKRETKLYVQRFYEAMQLFVNKHYSREKRTRFFMHIAIGFSKGVSLIKLFFKTTSDGKSKAVTGNRETLVVADQAYFNEMIQLIKHAKDPLVIQGRMSVDILDKNVSAEQVSALLKRLKKNNTGKIIFCENGLSFKKIIEVMQQLKGKVDFLIHANRSKSIVGSSSKNANGIFIAE